MKVKINGELVVNLKTYKRLKSKLPEGMDFQEWKEIMSTFLINTRREILNDPKGFVFPKHYLGSFQIIKNKPKYKVIDILATAKEGKACFYSNYHTFKYVYRLRWYNANFRMFPIYKFYPCREFKLLMAETIKSERVNYFTLAPTFTNQNKIVKV